MGVFKLVFSVILVLLVAFECCYCQTDEGAENSTLEPVSDLICALCACADGIVDCSKLNMTSLFELTDWDGLQDFQPKTVDLSQNLITKITRFSVLPIQVLNFSNCEIGYIEDGSFIYLQDLSVLDLTRNKIATSALSKKSFIGPLGPNTGPQEFKKMQYLSLAYNDLHSLSQDIFLFMSSLTYLDLSGNPLAFIDQVTMGSISDLQSLRELKLSGCELDTLPQGLLRRQRKLRRLDLSDNRFTTIPAVLTEASNLVYLNFDKNALQTLEANTALTNLTKLQELSLCRHSRLQSISDGALGGLSNLVTLRLNNNPRLTTLDPGFLAWRDEDGEELCPMLRELYLNNNNLSSIDSSLIDGWKDLETGDFSSSSYSCDCGAQWMVDVLVPLLINTPANASISNMVCKRPPELRGLTFSQLYNTSKVLVCSESQDITELPVANMAILLGIMIGIMVTFPLVLILVLLWRRGVFSRYRSRKTYPRDYEDEAENI